MFRLPIAPTFRVSATRHTHPPTPVLPIARIRTTTPISQYTSRFSSIPCTRTHRTRRPTSVIRALKQSPRSVPPQPFASSGQRYYSNGYNRYRRFDGPKGEPPVMRLVRAAKPRHFVIIGGVIGGFYIYNTETVEMTGRRRFNCVSRQQELKMGLQSYHEVLQQSRGHILPESHPVTIMVNRVLQRLIPQAPIDGADWKVHVIKDDGMMNAFVLPGGKVFVYTGILPICQDEDGLAAVLGHEIAHVVARHPAERMSNSIVTMGIIFVAAFLFDISGHIPSLFLNLVYGLPNSRTQEAEADNIGLMMMSKACFKPEAAVGLWARMQKAEKGAPPQFMSTHPSSYNRMEAIRGWLDKAQVAYEDSGCFAVGTYMPGFRQARNDFGW
ncbi:M48 family metallopeptidase [Aspergillus lucknowensis]|uniref:Peptidase family M48-domain-containing protein n=1 Tax=Aspergillus lucknowensis TaxID=176173 RepID=A0ABR4M0U8_9EURO